MSLQLDLFGRPVPEEKDGSEKKIQEPAFFDQRPENGCARCYWWQKHEKDDWGKCHLEPGVTTWWQHGPCPEYEKDPFVTDIIQLCATQQS